MSAPASVWPLRLLAISIAVVVWIFFSYLPRLQEISEPLIESTLEARVSYTTPDGFTVLNPGDAVTVRVRGTTDAVRSLSSDDVNLIVPFDPDVEASVIAEGAQNVEVSIDGSDVEVPSGIEVVSVTPDVLSVLVDQLVSIRVQITPEFTGEPTAGARVLYESVRVEPATALIRGPRSQIEELNSVFAGPISLDTHALTFTVNAPVFSEVDAVAGIQPSIVRVSVPMELAGDAATGGY